MLRRAVPFRAIRPASCRPVPSTRVILSGLQHVRFESQKAGSTIPENTKLDPASKKALNEEKNRLARDWDAKVLTYEEVKPRTEQPSPENYLIDVREPDEVIQGSIPSSVNLPLSVLAGSLHLPAETFKQKFGWEKPRTDQEIVFYCRSGKRSASACDIAKRNGFTNVLNYEGSWLDWTKRESEKSTS